MNKRAVGSIYEEHARLYLLSKGYETIEQNYYTKYGEIDLIATKDQSYVFVEVKYRRTDRGGRPYEAVGKTKQQRLMKSAMVYIQKHGLFNNSLRFDIIDILDEEVQHYENAFTMDRRYYR